MRRALLVLWGAWWLTAPGPSVSAQVVVPLMAAPSRQVTMFAIQALPNDQTIDPKLKEIAPQLKKLLPKHGFKLLDVQSKPLAVNQSIVCKVSPELGAKADLLDPLGADGKVQFRFSLVHPVFGPLLSTTVRTPPNQLFFCDKKMDDGSRLVIGIGAR